MPLSSSVSLLLALFAASAASQGGGTFVGGGPTGFNIFNNYCNRLRHQSTLKDGNVWIDGGIQVFANFTNNNPVTGTATGNRTTGQNTYMIQVAANYTWDAAQNTTQQAYQKLGGALATDTHPPIVMDGQLYAGAANDSRIWLFGGTTAYQTMQAPNFTYPTSNQYSLWSFDTRNHSWAPTDVRMAAPERPYNGFTADVPARGLGFWLNGAVDSGSSMQAQVLGSYHEVFQSGMVVLDLTGAQPVARNISGPSWDAPRVGGLMQYVPGYGAEGLLVAFGGGRAEDAAGGANGDQGTYVGLDDIYVFDVASRNASPPAWYRVAASGDVPAPREDACAVGFAAPDRSSYQIYVYGGRDVDSVMGDMYALSLPSFTWTQIPAASNASSPGRWGHTCQRAGPSQLILSGGASSVSSQDDCDAAPRGLAVFDVRRLQWGSRFTVGSAQADYAVPAVVAQAIGGTGSGNATALQPRGGWPSDGVAQLFGQQGPGGATSRLSGGAIAGIVVGVVVLAALLLGALAALLWRRRRRRSQRAAAAAATELDATDAPVELEEAPESKAKEVPADVPVEKDGTAAAAAAAGAVGEKEGLHQGASEMPASEPVYEMEGTPAGHLPGGGGGSSSKP